MKSIFLRIYISIKQFLNLEIDWYYISRFHNLSEKFIIDYQYYLELSIALNTSRLSNDTIEKVLASNKTDIFTTYAFYKYQNLSEELIEKIFLKYPTLVRWSAIFTYQKLSEKFIEKFASESKYLDMVSVTQKLSEEFIKKNEKKLSIPDIIDYQKISKPYMNTLLDSIDSEEYIKDLLAYRDSWINKDTEFKKQQVINTRLYKCYDDYFIAYKSIKKDRYSHYNFMYRYLKGGTYESHADYTTAENSFGLSVWTYKEAKNYSRNGKIVRCKIYYEDVARIVHNNGKIRCSKLKILT